MEEVESTRTIMIITRESEVSIASARYHSIKVKRLSMTLEKAKKA